MMQVSNNIFLTDVPQSSPENVHDSDVFSYNEDNKEIIHIALGIFTLLSVIYYLVRVVNRRLLLEQRESPLEGRVSFKDRCVDFFRAKNISRELTTWNSILQQYKTSMSNNVTSHNKSAPLYCRSQTEIVKPASLANIQEIFEKYVKGSILEVGSGSLEYQSLSYLGSLMPEKYLVNTTFSDRFELPKGSHRRGKKNKYIQLDLTKLTLKLKACSQTNIVASSVFDCISRQNLPVAIGQIHQVLAKNGKLLILSNLLFDQYALIEKYSATDNVVLPSIDDQSLGIKIISKAELRKRAADFGEHFSSFIEELLGLSSKELFNFLLFIRMAYNKNLLNLLTTFCPLESYHQIEHCKSFTEDLKKAIEDQGGFDILEFGYRQKEVLLEGEISKPAGVNWVTADLRTPTLMNHGFDPQVPPRHVKLGSTFFVCVAQKKQS